MEYRVTELAQLSGVSARTLRYYDQIGLLRPDREENGYRVYGAVQVDRLHDILLYRQMGLGLEEIRQLLENPDRSREAVLETHLQSLISQQEVLGQLIGNVRRTLAAMRGEAPMTDAEKFEGFKQNLIRENEEKYGEEVSRKYGRSALDESSRRVANMTPEMWKHQQALNDGVMECLKAAMEKGDPACEEAQRAADLHRQWLCMFWKEGQYSPQAHRGMAQMYVADERFAAYYNERLGENGARFLQQAIEIYTQRK